MSVSGTGKSLIALLERQYQALFAGDTFGFHLASSKSIGDGFSSSVTLFLYRVDVDPTRRHVVIPPTTFGDEARTALALDLRYLMTVWPADTVDKEHEVLQTCIEILEAHAILSGDLLAPGFAWGEDAQLRVALDSLTTEDMMRIWDSLGAPYQLSVPYVVRTVLVGARPRDAGGAVLGSTLHAGVSGR